MAMSDCRDCRAAVDARSMAACKKCGGSICTDCGREGGGYCVDCREEYQAAL